jgi:hypothetical protein
MKVIKKRELYACSQGDFVGKTFVVINVEGQTVNCLQIPEMTNIEITTESFDSGRNSGIIELVEVLPKDVFEVTAAQYHKNEDSNN